MDSMEFAFAALKTTSNNQIWDIYHSQLKQVGLEYSSVAHNVENDYRFPDKNKVFASGKGRVLYDGLVSQVEEVPFQLYAQILSREQALITDLKVAIQEETSPGTLTIYRYASNAGFEAVLLLPTINTFDNTYSMMATGHRSTKELKEIINSKGEHLQRILTCFSEVLRTQGIKNNTTTMPILSRRELDCLAWYNAGKSANEIGKKLNISEHTVNAYFRSARKRLRASTTKLAATRAFFLELYQH